jgi:hypothetical protein
MSVNIITEFKATDGRAGDLIALLRKLLPESLEHGGAEEICIRQNQDDPNDIISAQRWTSREVYLSYRSWRADTGVTQKITETLREPIVVRFFDDVPMTS